MTRPAASISKGHTANEEQWHALGARRRTSSSYQLRSWTQSERFDRAWALIASELCDCLSSLKTCQCQTYTQKKRLRAIRRLRTFRTEHEIARLKKLAGEHDVVFPYVTFQAVRMWNVMVAPPPTLPESWSQAEQHRRDKH